MDTLTIFLVGAVAITILIMVIFVDKKTHTELMQEIELSNNKIKKETKEQVHRVRTKTQNTMNAERVKS